MKKGRTYSTVISSLPSGDRKSNEYNAVTGYALRMTVDFTSSNLWTSPYSIYQQEIYGLIRKLHEENGWNFKQISDWLVENGYKTPRGKVFKENYVWSIYIKKQRSIQRFSREYDHTVTDMRVDGVDYLPSSG